MNALKKAETAKQAGEGVPPDATGPAAAGSGRNLTQELGLDPPATRNAGVSQAATAPVIPDAGPALMPMELTLEPDVTPVAPPATPSARDVPRTSSGRARSAQDTDRSGARTVFSAKQSLAASSKVPFYSLTGLCLVVGAAYGFYLWAQMQPPARPAVAAAAPLAQNRPIFNATNGANQSISASAAEAPLAAPQNSSDLQTPVSERGSNTGAVLPNNNTAPGAGLSGNLARRADQAEPFVQRESSAPTAGLNSRPYASIPAVGRG